MGLVNVAFFCADQESRRFVVWEIKCGDGHLPGFVVTGVDEFQRFLKNAENKHKWKNRTSQNIPEAEPAYLLANCRPVHLYCS